MKRLLAGFVARQAVMQGVLEQLAEEASRTPSPRGERTLFERGCVCGACMRALLPGRDVAAADVAWSQAHAGPACRPVSLVAAFELRHERAGLALQVRS